MNKTKKKKSQITVSPQKGHFYMSLPSCKIAQNAQNGGIDVAQFLTSPCPDSVSRHDGVRNRTMKIPLFHEFCLGSTEAQGPDWGLPLLDAGEKPPHTYTHTHTPGHFKTRQQLPTAGKFILYWAEPQKPKPQKPTEAAERNSRKGSENCASVENLHQEQRDQRGNLSTGS